MQKKLFRLFVRFVLNLIARVEILGLENVPSAGGFILASNHIGRLDAVLVFYALDREDVILPVAEKYRQNWFFRWIGNLMDVIWLDRFTTDFGAIRKIIQRMKQNGVLVIAPEGTRSRSGALIEAKPGVSFLAARAGVPIVPVALTGTEDSAVVRNLKRFRRSHLKVVAGQAFTLPQPKGKDREVALREQTDEIMARIAALLPEEYRGVYAAHPRLKALLQEA